MIHSVIDWLRQKFASRIARTADDSDAKAAGTVPLHEILLKELAATPHRPEIDRLTAQQARQRSTLVKHKLWLRLQTRLDDRFASKNSDDSALDEGRDDAR